MFLKFAAREPKPKITKADDHGFIDNDIVSVKPVPIELKWDMTDEEFEEYRKVASRFLSAGNMEFQEESLRRFLKKNNILIYSLGDVLKSLKFKSDGKFILRSLNISADKYKEMNGRKTNGWSIGGHISSAVFNSFVPLRVVKRLNLVSINFPKLCCFISDVRSDWIGKPPEYFVMVTLGVNFEVFAIDMWTEDESVVAKDGA